MKSPILQLFDDGSDGRLRSLVGLIAANLLARTCAFANSVAGPPCSVRPCSPISSRCCMPSVLIIPRRSQCGPQTHADRIAAAVRRLLLFARPFHDRRARDSRDCARHRHTSKSARCHQRLRRNDRNHRLRAFPAGDCTRQPRYPAKRLVAF
jgi:hypothetical protein